MISELKAYYKNNGILSTSFTCKYKSQCESSSKQFTGPKSSFISTGYEEGILPRLLFLSLDSGKGHEDPKMRLPLSVRKRMQAVDVLSIPKNRHWYRTHELAWYLLRRFDQNMTIEDTKFHFAHVNSAKCCMNKAGSKKADRLLFKNCSGYLKEELSILSPNIIVTQGNEAKSAIQNLYENSTKQFDDYSSLIRFNNCKIFWLHTYHPSNWGAFNKQRNYDSTKKIALGWERYSKLAHRHIS